MLFSNFDLPACKRRLLLGPANPPPCVQRAPLCQDDVREWAIAERTARRAVMKGYMTIVDAHFAAVTFASLPHQPHRGSLIFILLQRGAKQNHSASVKNQKCLENPTAVGVECALENANTGQAGTLEQCWEVAEAQPDSHARSTVLSSTRPCSAGQHPSLTFSTQLTWLRNTLLNQ